MKEWVNIIMFIMVLLNLVLLSSSRLFTCIRVIAFYGITVGILPLASQRGPIGGEVYLIAAVTILIKGIVFPRLLMRSIREADITREVEPMVSYSISMGMGILALAVSFWIASALPIPQGQISSPFVIPVSFSTILIGLFIIVTRIKALTQVLGYLVLENGIYSFSYVLLLEQPVLVEMGMLLDVFVAVFVMGIAIFHINREFDHIDTDALSKLGDWKTYTQKGVR